MKTLRWFLSGAILGAVLTWWTMRQAAAFRELRELIRDLSLEGPPDGDQETRDA